MDMLGRLHSIIFMQHQYMLNGVDVNVKLTTAKDVFNLIAPDSNIAHKSVIMFAYLIVRKAIVKPSISVAHEKALLQSNVKYSLNRVTIKTLSTPPPKKNAATHPGQIKAC